MKRPFPAPETAAQLPLSLSGEEGFQGPLDALLALLNGQPNRILQMSVAELTEQYMAWLESAQERGLANQIEFVETAVYLIRLKTNVLLHEWGLSFAKQQGASEGISAGAKGDPREDLQRRLQERQEQLERRRDSLRQAARELGSRRFGSAVFLPRGRDLQAQEKEQADAASLLVRIRQARRFYARPLPHLVIDSESLTEADLAGWLREQLEGCHEPIELQTLLDVRKPRREQCLLFLALLQGCQRREWSVQQAEPFGAIQVCLPAS